MKILIAYASAGAGHQKAAEAIYDGLKVMTGHEVSCVDALDYTYPFYKKAYQQTYATLISYLSWLWWIFFAMADFPLFVPLVRLMRRIQNTINGHRFHCFLQEQQFDYIFSTHFFPTEVMAALKRTGKIRSQLITVITDFDVHSIWLAKGVDRYTVASERTKEKLKRLGVAEERIVVTGIPTHTKFSKFYDTKALQRKLGLREDMFTILMATGSFGIGPMEEILNILKDVQVLVVCGHNKNLFERLNRQSRANIKIFPLVHNMEELMAVSQVMITKPGGLSISEALIRNLPLIFFSVIPGQEANNVKVLQEYGVGFLSQKIQDIGGTIERLKSSAEQYQEAIQKIKAVARSNAVRDIIAIINPKL